MNRGRPKLYRVVEWSKREWLLYRYDIKKKTYYLVDRFKKESLANDEMVHRYESRKLNKNFANKIENFNIRKKL